jgi:hypothetical protein
MSFALAKINKDNAICVCKLEKQQYNVLCICKNQQVANINNKTILITFTRINKTTITFQGEV